MLAIGRIVFIIASILLLGIALYPVVALIHVRRDARTRRAARTYEATAALGFVLLALSVLPWFVLPAGYQLPAFIVCGAAYLVVGFVAHYKLAQQELPLFFP